MGENTHQNCTRQNKNKEDPGRQQPCWGSLFCTNLTQPTGALDSRSSKELLECLRAVNEKEKAAILMVTHDAFTASYAKEVYILSDGVIKCKINRGKDRKEFYDRIIDMQASMGGDFS